jgi:UDP-N-acetyl-D-galactosamine dehydrogenase
MDINTNDVLEAAGTKWNFLPFRPGLVGGHCIGVDPYYLTHKAMEVGYNPEMILAGRTINDNMSFFIADQVTKLMTKKDICINGSNILIMGLAFKENCPDIRNTKVADLIEELNNFNCNVDVYDPWVDKLEAMHEYNIELINTPVKGKYDAIVIAVAHDRFKDYSPNEIKDFGKDNHVIYDIKYLLSADHVDGRI